MKANVRQSFATAAGPTNNLVLALVLCAMITGALLWAGPVAAQITVCAMPVDPIPSGPLGRTYEQFPHPQEHPYLHSSTHMQGVRSWVKWAGGLIHRPPNTTGFSGMTGAVVVDNPDPVNTVTVVLDYFDSTGTPAGSSTATILPEGHYVEAATALASTGLGMGTVRVTVRNADEPPIVGATLQHTRNIMGVVDPGPGANSMQQLQMIQEESRLLWGPMPISVTSRADFINGNLQWFHVVNPNNQPNPIQVNITYYDRTTGNVVGPFPWRTVTLPPYGTLTEISGPHLPAIGTTNPGLFNQLISLYTIPNIDWDLWVEVTSQDGLPLIGDGYLLDLVGPSDDEPRFRMASTMMSTTPQSLLLNPDLSIDLLNPPGIVPRGMIQTLVGVTNVGTAPAGPITIQYYNNSNLLLNTFNVPTLPAGASLRIEPGALGYPTPPPPVQRGFGWLRIIGCIPTDQLIGWSVREIMEDADGAETWHKAFGEALLRLNGGEPGPGWFEPVMNATRKVMPLVFAHPVNPPIPGYSTFGNFSSANIGSYLWELYDGLGGPCGSLGFTGLPFGYTSWTYEDIICTCFAPSLNGRVDHTSGRIEGIDVIGDRPQGYRIPGFATPIEPINEEPPDREFELPDALR